MANIDELIKEYVRDRDQAVLSMDVSRFRTFINKWALKGMIPPCFKMADNKVIEIALRKMVLGIASAPEEKREEARAWLKARGYREEF